MMAEEITKQAAISALKALDTIDYAADAIYLEDAIEAINALPHHTETETEFLERLRRNSDRIFAALGYPMTPAPQGDL